MVAEITIITVVKNNLAGIKRTLVSLRSQLFTDYEHIIVDSNSTDGTSEFIKKNLNSRTVYICEKDDGIYDAINKAIKQSKGNIIGLLHSGDLFFSENILGNICNKINGFDYIFGDIAFFKNEKINRLWKFESLNLFYPNPLKIAHTSLFIKKEIIRDLQLYDTNFKISSDTDFLVRLSRKKLKFKKLKEYLIFMESGGVSFSLSNYFKKTKEDLIILYRYYNILFIFVYIYKILIKFNGNFFYNYNKDSDHIRMNLKKSLQNIFNKIN